MAEVLAIIEQEYAVGNARAYLGEDSRLLEYGDANCDDKSQIYVAEIQRNNASKTITLLINRGDPNAVSQPYIDSVTGKVRISQPTKTESPGWSAHLVISLTAEKGKQHRACFEKMSHVSSSLVLSAIDKIVTRAIKKNNKYTYVVKVKKDKKMVEESRHYRPTLSIAKVPSENLLKDLENGELSAITLTKQRTYYSGPGAEDLIKRQEERILLRVVPADAGVVKKMVKGVVKWAKTEKFEEISFHLGRLPGGVTNHPTLSLDDQDALEQLYVRATRLTDFTILLEACYAEICPQIEKKMIDVVNGKDGW